MQQQKNDLLNNINIVIIQSESICQNFLSGTENFCTKIIDDWKNCCKVENYLPRVDEFPKWEEWHKLFLEDEKKHIEDGHNFNIFELLKLEFDFSIKETRHSKLIKFLLDTCASHGQGNKFLTEFLKLLNVECSKTDFWHIITEKYTANGNIDLLLYRKSPETIIIVENKSNWAKDQENQLYRYWYEEIYSLTKMSDRNFYSNNNKYQIIYLPPNECKTYQGNSILKPNGRPNEKPLNLKSNDLEINLPDKVPMDIKILYFNDFIQKWIENCKKQLPETNHRVREYLTQYQLLCNSL